MTSAKITRFAVLILTVWGVAVAAAESVEDREQLDLAWSELSRLLNAEAMDRFEALVDADPENQTSARLGLALALLNKQPKTNANVDRAAGLLDEVSTGGRADLRSVAEYYRGRIEQSHRLPTDYGAAKEIYVRLIERDPSHQAAQLAQVQLALLEIYDDSPLDQKRATLERLEKTGASLDWLPARRDFHLVLADGYANLFQDDAASLRNLLIAEEAGFLNYRNQADHWVRIGELARRLGDREMALMYYQKFLDAYARDSRRHTIEKRVNELENTL